MFSWSVGPKGANSRLIGKGVSFNSSHLCAYEVFKTMFLNLPSMCSELVSHTQYNAMRDAETVNCTESFNQDETIEGNCSRMQS